MTEARKELPSFIKKKRLIALFEMLYKLNRVIGLMSRVSVNGPGDRVSIPGRVIIKTQIIVLDSDLLNTQHHKVRIKGKVVQSRE